ncbi:MAG: trehalose-phosphatase [Chloroflexi bacterium]|nr:trehalose-phosphatase [Chloroflexota bacterium]
MPYLLGHLPAVEELLQQPPFGLITDFDGTIAEITPAPDEAHITPLCQQSLALLAQRLSLVAVVSGRPAAQVRDLVGVETLVYVGLHGLELWSQGKVERSPGAETYTHLIKAAHKELENLLSIPGILFEDKRLTLSLHYRRCPDPKGARKSILDALGRSTSARQLQMREGRQVVELLPPLPVNKGTALSSLVGKYSLRSALYLGDDLTDAEAFATLHRLPNPLRQGIAVAIVGDETPPVVKEVADYTLNGVVDVERFLNWLTQKAG